MPDKELPQPLPIRDLTIAELHTLINAAFAKNHATLDVDHELGSIRDQGDEHWIGGYVLDGKHTGTLNTLQVRKYASELCILATYSERGKQSIRTVARAIGRTIEERDYVHLTQTHPMYRVIFKI